MIFRGKHEGEALRRLTLDRLDSGGRRVPGHRTGIAEAEIEVAVPVHVGEVGAPPFLYEHRKATGPLGHPVHRHPFQQVRPGALRQRPRLRVRLLESPLLVGEELGESCSVNHRFPLESCSPTGSHCLAECSAASMTASPSSSTASSTVSGTSTRMTLPSVPAESRMTPRLSASA